MAYRRRQGFGFGGKDSTRSMDEIGNNSLAAKAIRASSSFRDSSLSSAYHSSSLSSPHSPSPSSSSSFKASSTIHDDYIPPPITTSAPQPPKQGFWELLARKAKGVIDDTHDDAPTRPPFPISHTSSRDQVVTESRRKSDNPALQKGLDAITSSLNYVGGTLSNAFEEGLTIVENRTADIIQETRKLQIKKKDYNSEVQNQASNIYGARQEPLMQKHMQPQVHTDLEIQLKASRDVAMAMAAKAKLLLRELKTVKADLAFAKERCGQLEEENRILRESYGKGDNPEDDDLIRLQLESLLSEKARLAQENSVFARENRFLREIVEYHQLTMQDVVYLDENNEDVTEVYPIKSPTVINLQPSGTIATSLPSPTPPPAAHLTTLPNVFYVVSSKQTPSL